MKISTKKGDDGTTSLVFGKRVSKASVRPEAYGALDEFSATLGLAAAFTQDDAQKKFLEDLQKVLVKIMTELATDAEDFQKLLDKNIELLTESDLQFLETQIENIEKSGVKFEGWVQVNATPYHAALSLARAQCRRAEREVVKIKESDKLFRDLPLHYLNRLSDLLWLKSIK